VEIVFYIVCSVILAAMLVAFLHWFMTRPRRMEIPRSLIEQMTSFAEEFSLVAENMKDLSDQFKDNSFKEWQFQNRRILRSLKQVNRLLQKMNRIFEKEKDRRERQGNGSPDTGPSSDSSGFSSDGDVQDFADEEEKRRFLDKGVITKDEIRRANWDEVIQKFDDNSSA